MEEGDDWMALAGDSEPSTIQFGEWSAPASFELFPYYADYFNLLAENVQLMLAELPHRAGPLRALQTYIQEQVRRGHSHYSQFGGFMDSLLQEAEFRREFEKCCQAYEQPELMIYLEGGKPAGSLPEKEVARVRQQQAETFQQRRQRLGRGWVPSINLALVGQVDHGKSSLLGRILREFDAGTRTEALSSCTDIYESEKLRGKTVEFSQHSLALADYRLNFFDTPGHRNYLSNALAAMRVADVVVLVVSAKKGEFEAGLNGGTIRELLSLAGALGVPRVQVVVTKMDTCAWDERVFAHIRAALQQELGALQLGPAEFVAFDSLTNANFREPRFWSPSLHQWLTSLRLPERSSSAELRLSVFDVQQIYGTRHIFGKIESGFVFRSMPVVCCPSGEATAVSEVYQSGEKTELAGCGDFVSITVKSQEPYSRGEVFCSGQVPAADQVLASFTALAMIVSGAELVVHLWDLIEVVSLEVLSVTTQDQKAVRRGFIRQGETGTARLSFRRTVALDREVWDRFVLRDKDRTLGWGTLLSPQKPQKRE